MTNDPPFRLTKWYLDCVSESGDAAIYYAAHVAWRALRLRYSSLLCHIAGRVTCKSSMRGCFPTSPDENTLSIKAPSMGVTGTWRRLDPPIERTLLEAENGSVHWHCLHPRASTQLRIRNHALEGLGYAERLTLTIPPWRLPLQRLQWGRWLSPSHSLIWIDWSGPHNYQRVWLNGAECPARAISPTGVQSGESIDLRLNRDVILRDGRLGNTVLPGAPLLARVFPHSMFGIQETKWLSGATLSRAGGHENGWAIHEVVEWTD